MGKSSSVGGNGGITEVVGAVSSSGTCEVSVIVGDGVSDTAGTEESDAYGKSDSQKTSSLVVKFFYRG